MAVAPRKPLQLHASSRRYGAALLCVYHSCCLSLGESMCFGLSAFCCEPNPHLACGFPRITADLHTCETSTNFKGTTVLLILCDSTWLLCPIIGHRVQQDSLTPKTSWFSLCHCLLLLLCRAYLPRSSAALICLLVYFRWFVVWLHACEVTYVCPFDGL